MASSSLLYALLLLLLLLHSTAAAAAHRSKTHPRVPRHSPKKDTFAPAAALLVIRQACRATRNPDLCESALSNISPPLTADASAVNLTLATLSAAARSLEIALVDAQDILHASASDVNRSAAARNCLEFFALSDRRLAAATASLPIGALVDARLFAGAAELYQYDCWSALKYVNGTQQVADAMAFIYGLANLTGGATAMIAALQRYGENTSLWAPPQTERDGYWPDVTPVFEGIGYGPVTVRGLMAPDATVCKGGGCRFETVQEVVEAAPQRSARQYVIHIKEGVYEETVRVPYEKTNLAFVGDGMGKTVITGSLSADTPGISTYNTATVGVSGDGFMARDLTFANTAGPNAHQAVAFRSDSDHSILELVEFLGHQDTLYAHSLRQFYNCCRIAGTVDYIFGNSAAVFRGCFLLILPRQLDPERGESNTITAHGRTDPAQPTGFVFDRCVLDGSDEYLKLYRANPAVHRVYLGRPWKEYSRTVFIGCRLAEILRPEGWLPWTGDFALATVYYGEFGSMGPGANTTGRVAWSSQIPAQHLGVYSLENFIQGNQWIPFAS